MSCKLCQNQADLRNSHVLPEFFYTRLYDEKHRFMVISSDSERQERFLQQGLYEKMLCGNCEVKFSVYENYARGVIFGGVQVQSRPEPERLLLRDVDYKQFRLFLLSLLWRMGVSELEFFSAVSLGPYEEKIRLMLVTDDPGDEWYIPCLVTGVLFDGKPGNWFVPPDRVRALGQNCYRLVICGMLFMFFVTNQKPPVEAMQYFVKRDSSLTIPVRNVEEIPFLHDVCIQMGAAMVQRPQRLRKIFRDEAVVP